MNTEKNINENEALEREEQAINEPVNVVKQDEYQPYVPTAELSNEQQDELR